MLFAPTFTFAQAMPLVSTAADVPLHEQVATQAEWWLQTQPLSRRGERGSSETSQRRNWESYCAELDRLWNEFRLAGYTSEAWRDYQTAAEQAKQRFVYGGPEWSATSA